MGVAYSGKTIVYAGLRSDSVAHLSADLDAVLAQAGWTGRTAVTSGYQYVMTSPQGFGAKLRVTDLGDTERFTTYRLLTLQLFSMDETVSGMAHKLATGALAYAGGFEVVAGCCQLFVAIRGVDTTLSFPGISPPQSDFACGIPYVGAPVDPSCTADGGSDTVSSIWWSQSRKDERQWTFRTGRYLNTTYSYCLNGVVHTESGANLGAYDGSLQLIPLTSCEDVDFWYRGPYQVKKYGTGDPMVMHPFIGWANKIHGQLWDSFLLSLPQPIDATRTTTETDAAGGSLTCTWLCWNYGVTGDHAAAGTWLASLHLLINNFAEEVANYAY